MCFQDILYIVVMTQTSGPSSIPFLKNITDISLQKFWTF